MSTKTTFKRIALVAVASLGLGLVASVSPANAAGDPTFAVDTSSVTVYTDSANATGETSTASKAFALVKITVSDADGRRALASNETITASVKSVPTAVSTKTLSSNATDLAFVELVYPSTGTPGVYNTYEPDVTSGTNTAFKQRNAANTADVTEIAGSSDGKTMLDGRIGSRNTAVSDSSTARLSGGPNPTYLLGIHGYSQAWDQGEYVVTLTMNDSTGFVTKVQDVTVKFVTSRATTGAAVTITQTGNITAGAVYTPSSTQSLTARLTNGTTGGRLYETSSTAWQYSIPSLALAIVDQDGDALTSTGLLIGDTGTTGLDTVAATGETSTGTLNRTETAYNDGLYGITTNATTTWDAAYENDQTAGNSSALRIRYGALEVTKTISVVATATATIAASSVSLTATGSKNHSDSANTLKMDNGNRWTVPLTTKTMTLKVRAMSNSTDAVANYPLTFTMAWTGASQGEVTPRSGSTYKTVVTTDSSGYASLTITNNSPIDGATATVTVTGFTGTAAGQVIVWEKNKPSVVTVSPSASYDAAVGSTQEVTWTFTDTFGAPVVGEIVDLTISGANSATSTVVIPSKTTDATGSVSYTFTDAAGVEDSATLGTTTLTATSRTVTSVTASRIITWKTTVATIATLTGYFNDNEATSGASAYSDVVPTTPMYDTASSGTKYLINTARNLTRSMLLAGEDTDQIAFRYIAKDSAGALVTGVPVTVSVSAGLHILNSLGLPVSSRTIYPGTGGTVDFIVMATATGTHTITVSAGAVSATAQVVYGNALTDARTVVLASASASGTANAETLPSIKATVTDRWGNPVSGASLTIVHTGVGRLAGGQKSLTYTTNSTGEYVIEATSTEAGSATVSVTATAASGQLDDIAGYVGTTELIDTVAAGVKSVTGSFTFTAGTSSTQAAAEAATDAAAEAIDAANAATDAANLAAEAADAATVAAEEARDAADAATAAVEELATQVATLMAALKAQITTLANTVAKIAKKVKA